MILSRHIIIGAVVGLALLIALGWGYWYYGYMRSAGAPEQGIFLDASRGNGAGSASSAPVIVGVEGSGNYKVEPVSLSGGDARKGLPSLHRPIVFSPVFSPEAQRIMTQKIAASISALEKDPRLFDEWMQLAILRKTVDDYEGARQIWEFLKTTNPRQPGIYANLAALYGYELKNPALAEENFTLAIQKGPKEVSIWRNAYDFYRYVRKDDGKAKQTLENGIKETQSSDLQYLLDHYSEL